MADSNRNVKIVAIALAALLLLGSGAAVIANDDDKDKPGPGPCPKNYHWSPLYRVCVPNYCPPQNRGPDGQCKPDVDPKGDIVNPTTGECPAGMIKNAARLKALATGKKGAELEAELAKYPECVPIQCPQYHHRDEFGACIFKAPDCPQGMQWSIAEGKCVEHVENCAPGEQWSHTLMRCVKTPTDEPTDNDDPKDIPSIIKDFPEGANFYQVRPGDIFEGTKLTGTSVSIAYAFLRRECFLAAKEFGGLDDAAAGTWAADAANPAGKADRHTLDVILCGGTNDACYGTYGYCGQKAKAAGRCRLPNGSYIQNHPGPHGRAIQLEPKHPNNRSRLINGDNLARGVTIGTPAQAGDGKSARVDPSFQSLPLLWMPKLDRKKLWDSKGKVVEISSETWSDGTTKGWPPPIVMDRLLHDFANTGRKAWGCMQIGMEVE